MYIYYINACTNIMVKLKKKLVNSRKKKKKKLLGRSRLHALCAMVATVKMCIEYTTAVVSLQ